MKWSPFRKVEQERSTLSDVLPTFGYQGNTYPMVETSYGAMPTQEIGGDYVGQGGILRFHPIAFACAQKRSNVFGQASLRFRDTAAESKTGRPGKLFGTQELAPLEHPWAKASTQDLLSRAIADVDASGNAYFVRQGDELHRLHPQWVTIAIDGGFASDARIAGYLYKPQGNEGNLETFLPEQILHWAPIVDPYARWRGMSWLTPVLRELETDCGYTDYKQRYLSQGATPNLIIEAGTFTNPEAFEAYRQKFAQGHEGLANSGRPLLLANGATATVVGSNLKDLDLSSVQGIGERRIAAAAGVPGILVGINADVDSTYANFGQARRSFSDITIRPLWQSFCNAAASVINIPLGAELWYDDRDVSFNQEDVQDAATIRTSNATAIRTLVDGGFDPESVVKAIDADDLNLLKHSGHLTVQVAPEPMKAADSLGVTNNGN